VLEEGAQERDLCWYGDAPFLPHLWKVLGSSGFSAQIRFGQPQVYVDVRGAARNRIARRRAGASRIPRRRFGRFQRAGLKRRAAAGTRVDAAIHRIAPGNKDAARIAELRPASVTIAREIHVARLILPPSCARSVRLYASVD